MIFYKHFNHFVLVLNISKKFTSFFSRNFEIVGNKAEMRIAKRMFQENKAHQVFRKTNIFYPLIRLRTCAYQGAINVRFSENLCVLCFLETPVLRFALLLYYRRNVKENMKRLCNVSLGIVSTYHFDISEFKRINELLFPLKSSENLGFWWFKGEGSQ